MAELLADPAVALVVLALAGLAVMFLGIYVLDRFGRRFDEPYQESRRAAKRAEALLRDLLTSEEYDQLCVRGYLEVPSRSHAGRVYRISQDGRTLISLEDGKFSVSYCVGPVEPVPSADRVAVHKLMLEGAESDYLRTANARIRVQDRR